MVAYFVGTALTTVRPVSPWTRRINAAALTVAIGLAVLDIAGGMKAFNSPRRSLNGVPFFMLFILATVMILAAAGDVRVLRSGMPRGGPRLARHLWRMCFALFIATASFFLGQAKVIPKPIRIMPLVYLICSLVAWGPADDHGSSEASGQPPYRR